MKKLASIFLICLFALSSYAQSPFYFLEPIDLELKRPYFDLSYAEIHNLSSEKQDKDAYFEGGLRYYYGYTKRLEMPFHKDYNAAALWFYEAGMLDHPIAAYYLGSMYTTGQGIKTDYKKAFWWLEKARKLGVEYATHLLANLYYESYNKPNVPDTYKEIYEKKINFYLDELMEINYPEAFYNKALFLLQTQDNTRFVKKDANDLMVKAIDIFINFDDYEACYEALKVMKFYKLEDYKKTQMKVNSVWG